MIPNMNLSEARRPKPLDAGAYVVIVKAARVDMKYNRLQLDLDIHEGPKAGHFTELQERANFWGLTWNLYMDEDSKWKFSNAMDVFRECNPNFVWHDDADNDEQTLVGKTIGMVTREKQYIGNDGLEKSKLVTYKPISIDDVRAGNYQIPEPIMDTGNQSSTPVGNVVDTTNDEIPAEFMETADETPF